MMKKRNLKRICLLIAGLSLLVYSVFTISSCGARFRTAGNEPTPGNTSSSSAAASASSVSDASPQDSLTDITLSFGTFSVNTTAITGIVTAEDLAQLEGFTHLQTLDATGSTCKDALFAFASTHPTVNVLYEVQTPNGSMSTGETSLALTALDHNASAAWAAALPAFRNLQQIDLGDNTSGSRDLTPADIRSLKAAAPQAEFLYRFTAFGQVISLSDEELNFNHITMSDNGAEAREILSIMNHCTLLDMDTCGVDNEHMAAIRDAFPETNVVWRVWFGENYTVRTDTEKILASKPSVGGNLTVDNIQDMKYCTKVKYLDIGHNQILNDISIVAYMPELEVAVLAMVYFDDLSPLAGCTKLEYLEIQSNGDALSDLSPLSGLSSLEHLNIGNLPGVTDLSPLYGLTNLKRLWVTARTPIPADQISAMQSLVPDCTIDTESYDPTEGGWRYVASYVDDDEVPHWVMDERYYELTEQFGYQTLSGGYSFPSNDPYLDGTPDEEELAAAAAQEEVYRQTRRDVYNHSRSVVGLPGYSGTRLPK